MKKKILIVEDEPDLLAMLELKACNLGYHIKTDPVGDQTLSLANDFQPHLILLDMMLPTISGLDILRGLKNEPHLKKIPVIIFSALEDKYVIDEALSLGAAAYFIKGEPINDLFTLIANHL